MLEAKALAAMRRYRQAALYSDPAARAIRRLVRTRTWRAIVADRVGRQRQAAGERLARLGY